MNEIGIHHHYWDSFYSKASDLDDRSDFATFVASRFNNAKHVIDCGSGNGRDSFYFAARGKNVLSLDASAVAVAKCNEKARKLTNASIEFQHVDFGDTAVLHDVVSTAQSLRDDAVIYGRFFIHAIDNVAEANFLRFANSFLGQRSAICLEFRTNLDSCLQKVAPAHFRRFIEPVAFLSRCLEVDLHPTMFVQGFGMAQYKTEDAHVARIILERAPTFEKNNPNLVIEELGGGR